MSETAQTLDETAPSPLAITKGWPYYRSKLFAEQAALDAAPGGPRLRLTATGQLRLFEDVNSQLLGGLAASFGGAVRRAKK